MTDSLPLAPRAPRAPRKPRAPRATPTPAWPVADALPAPMPLSAVPTPPGLLRPTYFARRARVRQAHQALVLAHRRVLACPASVLHATTGVDAHHAAKGTAPRAYEAWLAATKHFIAVAGL